MVVYKWPDDWRYMVACELAELDDWTFMAVCEWYEVIGHLWLFVNGQK